MHEISYATYCYYGALRNPHLFRENLYGTNGRFIKTRYYCDDASKGRGNA